MVKINNNYNNYEEKDKKVIQIVLITKYNSLSKEEVGESTSSFLMENLTNIKDSEGCVIPMSQMTIKVMEESI